MYTQTDTSIIKQVGMNGQISLGKEYAGKQIQISKLEDGTLIIKPGRFIPNSEQWLYTESNMKRLDKAIKWAENSARKDNFSEIINKIEND
jgi:hypothetical protein